MTLIIDNSEHFEKVKKEAERLGLMEKLQSQLDYLANYANHGTYGEVECHLGYDFAPLSFSFVMKTRKEGENWKYWFNGGLIFHPGKMGPDKSFSVELVGSDEPHWSVHT